MELKQILELEAKPDSYWYDQDSKKETIFRLHQALIEGLIEHGT